MSKLHELGGHKYTAGFLVAHSDERVKAAGRDILALIERVEELDKQLLAARELVESVKVHHRHQSAPYDVPFEKCIDAVCIQAREFLKMLEE